MVTENKSAKELVVSAIENGTVIDHIPTQSVFRVISILNLDKVENQVLFGTGLDSRKYGKKGIVKISNRFFEPDEINKIALVAPTATLIIIRNFRVTEKKKVEVPDEIHQFVKCVNPNCITNHEAVVTHFSIVDKTEMKLKCRYCEKITERKNMTFL
ncbi:MAG: aspartate carbamoyltransferase regulatory subunit [Bacteroidota bacterium]